LDACCAIVPEIRISASQVGVLARVTTITIGCEPTSADAD
jgi:hypothetical protein